MKGQIFTIHKLHYINGVVYEVAKAGTTDLKTLSRIPDKTTKSGDVQHPQKRVKDLARLAEGMGLIQIFNENQFKTTKLGRRYAGARSGGTWKISKQQQNLLCNHIFSDTFRSRIIFTIITLLELVKKGYTGKELSHKWAFAIGKEEDWNSEVTYRDATKFVLNYIDELGLKNFDVNLLPEEDASKEQKYQNALNIVEPIQIPPGKIPRPKPTKIGETEKYSTNPRIAKTALENANYKCELDPAHDTFINKKSNKQYMEAHHLIPMSNQSLFKFDIDVPENILCLCPTCHRKFHHAQDTVKKNILSKAFKERERAIIDRGIILEFNRLLSFYSVN